MAYTNHVIDPTYFYDAIEEFAFNYQIFIRTEKNIDEYGCVSYSYEQNTIRGSLQTQGSRLNQSKSGNKVNVTYKFYCKSLYRIDIGDVIYYKEKYLMCIDTHEYDEYGVREATLEMVTLTEYKDLAEYINYLNGVELV